ncbi:MAG: cyclic nucleotide-binding domain-containing protein [Chloroflexi bacterium]|nr:cyclic nucleotide-binding domain-containing protein [Chloroflexota bacterium]
MDDADGTLGKRYLEGNSISPNELHIQYGIPREEIASFRNLIYIYPNREVIIKEGDQEKALYLLRLGTVEVFKGGGASRESIGTIEAVNFFGEMSMINDEPRSATVISQANNVVVYRIPNPNIQTILTNPKWAELLISRLCKNLARSLNQQMIVNELVMDLRSDLERSHKELQTQRLLSAQTAHNTRLAFNGIIHFQEIVQKMAVVGSKGWAYLNTLTQVTRTLGTHYIADLDNSDKQIEISVIRNCLSTLPQDEQSNIIQELNKLI